VAGRPFDPALVNNLNKLHNRGYTPGFLTNQRDDKLQRYEEGLSNLYTQEFGAVVKASEAGRLLITPRNKLMVGDAIEVISPEGAFEQRIESFTNLAGEKIDALHGGTAIDAWIPSAQEIHSPFALVSKIIPKMPQSRSEAIFKF